MFKNKWLLIILSSIIIYSCQSPQASEQDTELEKIKYSEKIIEVSAKEINRTVFSHEVLSNGILTPVKKAKLVFNVNENIIIVNAKKSTKIKVENERNHFYQVKKMLTFDL